MKKRILSILLTLCMVLSIMPMSIFAEEVTETTPPPKLICNCADKCTAAETNPACPVCGAVGADLALCGGEIPCRSCSNAVGGN